jgi:hypothetical protein
MTQSLSLGRVAASLLIPLLPALLDNAVAENKSALV